MNSSDGFCLCGCGEKTEIAPRNIKQYGWIKNEPKPYIRGHNRRGKKVHSSIDMATRFWSKVDKSSGDDACWNWTAYIGDSGYGQFGVDGKLTKSHRLAWELVNGNIPPGLWVLHKCDNRKCCNPSHLFLGTPTDNARDMISKGRRRPDIYSYPGESHTLHKLTDREVLRIRDLYAAGGTSHTKLANEFHISKSQVKRIIDWESWRHI